MKVTSAAIEAMRAHALRERLRGVEAGGLVVRHGDVFDQYEPLSNAERLIPQLRFEADPEEIVVLVRELGLVDGFNLASFHSHVAGEPWEGHAPSAGDTMTLGLSGLSYHFIDVGEVIHAYARGLVETPGSSLFKQTFTVHLQRVELELVDG